MVFLITAGLFAIAALVSGRFAGKRLEQLENIPPTVPRLEMIF